MRHTSSCLLPRQLPPLGARPLVLLFLAALVNLLLCHLCVCDIFAQTSGRGPSTSLALIVYPLRFGLYIQQLSKMSCKCWSWSSPLILVFNHKHPLSLVHSLLLLVLAPTSTNHALVFPSLEHAQPAPRPTRELCQEVCPTTAASATGSHADGQLCRSRYSLGKTLGAGTYGIVREAEGPTGQVAVKIILKKNVKGNEQMVLDELEMLQRLKHPNIVKFVDWFESRVGCHEHHAPFRRPALTLG